jgi:L-fuconolactonase
VHLFAEGFSGVYGRLIDDELALYEQLRIRFGIERALVVGYEGEPRYAGNNGYILALARTRPWISPVAYVQVDPAPTVESLRLLQAEGAIGYALYLTEPHEAEAVAAWPRASMRELEAQRPVISLNATPAATRALEPVIDTLCDCTFLFSHLGLPGRFPTPPTLEEAIARLRPLLTIADRQNVAVKLSGLYAISDPAHDFPHSAAEHIVEAVLAAYGPGRVCWGSDYTPAFDFVSFAQLADARLLRGLRPVEINGIMGENLQRLLPPLIRKE